MIAISIDESCIKCKRCVNVCPAKILQQHKAKEEISIHYPQNCIECGQCVSICPTNSVRHSLFPEEKVHDLNPVLLPSPESVMEILRKRRSNRSFSDKEIPLNFLEKILEAANLAPTAKNKQSLEYTLVTNTAVLEGITKSTIEVAETLASADPHLQALVNAYNKGRDPILRGAKAVIIIHSKANCAPDANLAYQNASIMAESLNVAHFYTGYVCILSMHDKAEIIKKHLGIEGNILAGMALAMPKDIFKKYTDRKPQIVNRIL